MTTNIIKIPQTLEEIRAEFISLYGFDPVTEDKLDQDQVNDLMEKEYVSNKI